MADTKLLDLTAASTLTGTESIYGVQSGNDVKITSSQLATYVTTTGGGVSGTAANTQVSYWTGTSTQGGDTSFTWDNTNKRLGVGTAGPLTRLHVQNGATTIAYSPNARTVGIFEGNNVNGAVLTISSLSSGYSGIFFGQPGTETGGQINYDHTTSSLRTVTSGGVQTYLTSTGLGLGGSTIATHTLTLPSTSTGISYYNTVDQTVNYERVRQFWTGSVYTTVSENGGTGTIRNIAWSVNNATVTLQNASTAAGNGGVFLIDRTGGHTCDFGIQGGFTASAITQYGAIISNQVSQTGSASYEALRISPNISSVGSGSVYLLNLGTNSSTNNGGAHTSVLNVNTNGIMALGTSGRIVIGTVPNGAKLGVGNDGFTTGSTYSTEGMGLQVRAATYSSLTSTGTIPTSGVNTFGIPTLAASNATTLTNVSSLYIDGAPVAGTNVTIGSSYALYINNGTNYFGGSVNFFGGSNGIAPVASIGISGSVSTGITSSTAGRLFAIGAGTITRTGDTGTIANSVSASLGIPTLAAGATTTYTNASTFYIDGPPVAGTNATITNRTTAHFRATAGENLRLSYDDTNYAWFTVSSTGLLTINSQGGVTVATGFGFGFNGSSLALSAGQANLSPNIASLSLKGSNNVNAKLTSNANVATAPSVGFSFANYLLGSLQNGMNVAASGTHPLYANIAVKPLTINAGTATVTQSASLYVEGASTGATSNYSVLVDSANVPWSVDASGVTMGQMTQLFRVTGLNAVVTANTLAYTNNTGKTLSISQVAVVCTAATAITTGPAIGIGTSAGTSDMIASTAMNALTTTSRQHYLPTTGGSVVVPNGGTIYINLTAATGTAQTVTLAFAGFAY